MSSNSKTVIYTVRVEFGDCDPAGIVWFPNFFRWIDAASRHFFAEHGLLKPSPSPWPNPKPLSSHSAGNRRT